MRFFLLIIVLVTFFCRVEAQRNVLDKKITTYFYQQPLSEVLVEISRSTKVNISFDPAIIEHNDLVTIQLKKERLGDVLDVLLADRELEYFVSNEQVIILRTSVQKEVILEPIAYYGYVEDIESKERLPYATIFSEDQNRVVYANEYGFFRITVSDTLKYLNASYIGYSEVSIGVSIDTNFVILRLSNINKFDEVIITDSKLDKVLDAYDIHVKMDMGYIQSMNQFAGVSDIVRNIQSLPGVSSGADGLGGFSVRGANADKNLILLDGVPVYNASHALGVLSIFNPTTIKSAQFYRSHIPSQYGGRLASVLDIRTREGSLTAVHGSVDIGVITAAAHFEGPILKDKLSFMVSGRRTLLEPFIGPVSASYKSASGIDGKLGYFLGDLNAKLQYVINPKNRLYLSYYSGIDSFTDTSSSESSNTESFQQSISEYDWTWGNQLVSFRWASEISTASFSQLTFYTSGYDFRASNFTSSTVDTFEINSFYELDGSIYDTEIKDIGIKWDYDNYLDKYNTLKLGVSIVRHDFRPGLISERIYDRTVSIGNLQEDLSDELTIPSLKANEIDLYIDNTYKSENLVGQYGVRMSVLTTDNRNYWNLQPRLSVKTKIQDWVYAKLSGNITTQYLHLLSNSSIGLPTDIWIPSSTEIRPEIAYQFAGGFDFKIGNKTTIYSEAYYKYLQNVLNLQEGALFSVLEDTNWENNIPVGIGFSYGLELGLKTVFRTHQLEANYTYGQSKRKFDEINSGLWFYSRFDRRHQVKAAYIFELNENIQFSSAVMHATGHPQTLPTLILDNRLVYTAKNNQRLPYYQRLDVGVQIKNKFSWGEQKIHIGVYNVLNRSNPYFYFTEFSASNPLQVQFKQVTLFPLLPNVSYSIQF